MMFEKFFESDDELAVHCENEKDAELLVAMFDDAGYKWNSDEPYAIKSNWQFYRENTCYINNRRFGSLDNCKRILKIKVISFREFLAEEFMSVLQSLKSLNLRGVLADYNYILLINDALDAYAEFKEGGEI